MKILLSFLLLITGCTITASAHEGRPIYVEVQETEGSVYSLRWKIPPVMVSGSEPIIAIANCTLTAGSVRPQLAGVKLYQCAADRSPRTITLEYSGINPVLSTLVLYSQKNGSEFTVMSGPEERSITLPAVVTFTSVAVQYATAGFEHILEGYDHLLFVFCLVLVVGTFRRTLIAITGFTLGHSITLGMSAMAQWSLPPMFVEPLIAFSVLILAVEKASGKKDTLTGQYPTLIATSFGLLHGFGFGGALAELGLPQTLQLQALAFFNVGVELGQALFVLTLFAAYKITHRTTQATSITWNAQKMSKLAVYPAGVMASFWTIERVIGIWL